MITRHPTRRRGTGRVSGSPDENGSSQNYQLNNTVRSISLAQNWYKTRHIIRIFTIKYNCFTQALDQRLGHLWNVGMYYIFSNFCNSYFMSYRQKYNTNRKNVTSWFQCYLHHSASSDCFWSVVYFEQLVLVISSCFETEPTSR